MNLAGPPGYASVEQPFLNIFKTGVAWQTRLNGTDTGEEVSFYQNCLDSNGYPTSISCHSLTFTSVSAEFFLGLNSSDKSQPTYRAGDYLLQWSGNANVTASRDASATCTTSPCKITISSPTTSGLLLTFTCTGTGCAGGTTPFTNVSLIFCGTWNGNSCSNSFDSALANGAIFDPVFLNRIRPFRMLRFMDWMATLNNFQTNWSNRPTQGYVFWSGSPTNATINGAAPDPNSGSGIDDGVPAEILFALCNEISADCWFDMPPLANDTYITNFATLAHNTLNAGQKAYVEYANELWNQVLCPASGTMTNSCIVQVSNLCNSILGSACPYPATFTTFQANSQFSAYMAVHVRSLWRTAWGADASRVVGVFGGQNGNPSGYTDFWLTSTLPGFFTGPMGANIDAVAVAPYHGGTFYAAPDAWTANTDGGLANLFADLETGLIPNTLNSGNCGNGAGVTCTPADSAHFTFTSGLSLPATPTNGQLITAKQNAANTLSSGQTFLAVDGGTSYPIMLNDGNCPGHNITAGFLPINSQSTFAFTNAIAGCGVGTLTAGWRPVASCCFATVGQIAIANNLAQSNCTFVKNDGPGLLLGYESGQQFATSDPVLQTLYVASIRNSRMYDAYNQSYNGWKALTSCTPGAIAHFDDMRPIITNATNGWFGALENFQQPTSSEYQSLSTFH